MVKNSRSGFTLIELLVVISIIAVLMSILMPSLTLAREQAKSVICRSNLKNWGIVVAMYTGDNNGSFWTGFYGQTNPDEEWIWALKRYYDDDDLRLCPSATKLITTIGGPKEGWYIIPEYPVDKQRYFRIGDYGSYGSNGWLMNPPANIAKIYGKYDAGLCWRRALNIRNAANVPIFGDCQLPLAQPLDIDRVPAYNGELFWGDNHMGRFAMSRHGRGMNIATVDGAATHIEHLKMLWSFDWNNKFDTSNIPDDSEFSW